MAHFDQSNVQIAQVHSILVTGGAGFIGGHLVEALTNAYPKAEITVLDALTYAALPETVSRLRDMKKVELVIGDVCDRALVRRLVTGKDIVFHLAAESHVPHSFSDSTLFDRVNRQGTGSVLSASIAAGVKRVIHFSTDEIYGPCLAPAREDQPARPTTPYAASKLEAERLVHAARSLGLDVIMLRPSNAVGCRQHPEKLVPGFVAKAISGEPMPVEGSGLQLRTFLPVGDLAQAAVLSCSRAPKNATFNIAGRETLSVIETGKLIAQCAGVPAQFVFKPDREVNDQAYMLDGGLLAALGYRQVSSLREEVLKIVAAAKLDLMTPVVEATLVPTLDDISNAGHVPVFFHVPHRAAAEARYLSEALSSGRLSAGGRFSLQAAARLEQLTGCGHVRLTHSCTAAMETALMALDIGTGDEVVVPTFTFAATATAVARTGAKAVLCDVDPRTLMLTAEMARRKITDKTKAIMVVHYGGAVADVEPLKWLADLHGIALIEDAAQSLGAKAGVNHAGTTGIFGAVSFHDTKIVGCGHGGALLCNTDDPALLAKVEQILDRGTDFAEKAAGRVPFYQWVSQGSSFRLPELQAAVLCAQLDEMETVVSRRLDISRLYASRLSLRRYPWTLLDGNAKDGSNGHIFALLAQSPEGAARLMANAAKQGIQMESHYTPLHLSPYARSHGLAAGRFDGADHTWARLVRLPVHTGMSHGDAERVVQFLEREACDIAATKAAAKRAQA